MPGEGENREGLFVGFHTGIGMGSIAGHGKNKTAILAPVLPGQEVEALIGCFESCWPLVAWFPTQNMGVAVDIDLSCLNPHALVCIQHRVSVERQLLDKTAGIHIQSGV